MKPADNLIDLLLNRSASPQKDAGYRFLLNGEDKYEDCSYEELAYRARVLAAELQRRKLKGERGGDSDPK